MKKLIYSILTLILGLVLSGSGCTPQDTFVLENDVLINGVIWAGYNVNMPENFAVKAEVAGRFFKWNSKVSWSTTGDINVTNWNSTIASGISWVAANDPCPNGYRLPIKADFDKLRDASKVEYKWVTVNGIKGGLFKDKSTGKNIFLPAAGARSPNTGALYDVGIKGYYWSSSHISGETYILKIKEEGNFYDTAMGLGLQNGQSVRCVMK